MGPGESERYLAVAEMFTAMEDGHTLEDLAWTSASTALRIFDAASCSLSRYDAETGTVRTLVNVGQLGPAEQERPLDEKYQVTAFPNLLQVAEQQEPWSLHLGDAGCDAAERRSCRTSARTPRSGARCCWAPGCGASCTPPATARGDSTAATARWPG